MEGRTAVVSTTAVSRPQPADLAGEDGEGYRSPERPTPGTPQAALGMRPLKTFRLKRMMPAAKNSKAVAGKPPFLLLYQSKYGNI